MKATRHIFKPYDGTDNNKPCCDEGKAHQTSTCEVSRASVNETKKQIGK